MPHVALDFEPARPKRERVLIPKLLLDDVSGTFTEIALPCCFSGPLPADFESTRLCNHEAFQRSRPHDTMACQWTERFSYSG